MKAACDELGVTLIAYSPIAQGEIPISLCSNFSVYYWFYAVSHYHLIYEFKEFCEFLDFFTEILSFQFSVCWPCKLSLR